MYTSLRRHVILLWTLALLAASCVWIDPLRETPLEDDWAYARTAETLRDTGDYVQHDWLAPNYPAHAAIGAAAQTLFGASFAALRLSTLALGLLALISLYALARAHRLPPHDAGMLALFLLACPLFLRYCFNYMTDVPFLAWFTAALAAYTTGLRRRSMRWMLIGALAAAAAVLTRQFGVVVLFGLGACWWQTRPRSASAPLFAVAALGPASAAAWQIYAALTAPSWSAQAVSSAQREFLFNLSELLIEIVNRIVIILHYLAFFTVPLVVLILLVGLRRWLHLQRQIRDVPAAIRNTFVIVAATALIALAAFALMQSPLLHNLRGRSYLMPYLPWNFGILQQQSTGLRVALTAFTLVGAVYYAKLVATRIRALKFRPVHERLLDYTTLAYLAVMLLFIQVGDEYLLPFVPWALVVAARALRPYRRRYRIALFALATVLALIGAAWTRGLLAINEARWELATEAVNRGAAPSDVYSTWTWTCYHQFHDYVALAQPPQYGHIAQMFSDWLPRQREQSTYWVIDESALAGYDASTVISSRNYWRPFGNATLYLVRRRQ